LEDKLDRSGRIQAIKWYEYNMLSDSNGMKHASGAAFESEAERAGPQAEQGARYMCLLFGALMAEDEGL
jgi:hypothetical protein